jgi:Arc/MetJ-type ribon-helix-helix transcriptional regulator
MTTISVPLTSEAEAALNELVEITGANRSAVIRKAIERYREDEAVTAVLLAEQEITEGKVLRGSLEDLLATD